ncbi:hypothetical protein CONCODRAFT_12488 [Conidiobolus coronatus NRRL 28638]|uniref:Uncharacterized protein n=1 Tax=Conidiobolus coronatus (strain ATCC 28846 / CBS 209.66 / NRRL 28638) TaxID=796925 RepID=A0A137NT12_CONC2|nr:hypothetical protein CONCODRAFT_12488 [Conidiobolus coronatus NRRL 28638]|eukprot:KXN65824.1 hypothetical protein CONCODRAFT_12488 [Conidiobolus coronatus NRRL 28638]
MILIYLIYIAFTFAEVKLELGLSSGILKNDKFYVYFPAANSTYTGLVNTYTLKDGPISQINKTQVNITNAPLGYMPQFLNFTQDIQNGVSNKLWLLEGYTPESVTNSKLDRSKWMAQFVDDKQLNFGSSFIKTPNYTYFPKGGFTQNIVNINNNPVMYIIGGYVFSNELKNAILTSYVFKYDFNSNSWSDLSVGSKSILPPIAIHRSVQVNNALFIFNGLSPNGTNTRNLQVFNSNDPVKDNTVNKAYKFDLLTEKWSVVDIKTNLDSARYGDGSMLGASYNYYNGNIVSYGALDNLNSSDNDPYFGTLDLSKMEWRWNQINTDSGLDNNLKLLFHQTLIIRDQLILFQSYSNQYYATGPFVINLKEFKFQSFLDYSGSMNSSEIRPVYINVIIGLGATLGCLLIIALIIFIIRYRKNKSKHENNNQINPLWAAPVNQKHRYTPGGEIFDDGQTGELFSLENAENLDCSKARSSFMQEDLNSLTLVKQELDKKIASNNSTNIDP